MIAGAALLAFVGVAVAQSIPSKPNDYVVDQAGVIDSAARSKLNRYLKALEQACGAQFIVLTVRDTGGTGVEDMAVRVFEDWKLGQKGEDNGVLFLIAVGERRAKIEVGYGLEGVLTDAFTGRVAREIYVPHFKQGDYGGGIWEGTLVLANAIAADANVVIPAMPVRSLPPSARSGGSGRGMFRCLGIAVILLIFLGRGGHTHRHSRYSGGSWIAWMLLGSLMGGGRSWGGGGGGFGGGGGGFGGGFGGGGGGSSGGGGASFGW